MKITARTLPLIVALSSSATFAQTNCWTEKDFSIQKNPNLSIMLPGPSPIFDETEQIPKAGNELGSGFGVYEGSDLVFNGRPVSRGGYVYGTYPSWPGSKVTAWAKIEFSTDWKPDSREVCTRHKTILGHGRVCQERGIEYSPTSFVVDMTSDVGTRRFVAKTFENINNANHWVISTPEVICLGPIDKFEVRILDLTGGEVNFRVHNITYYAGMNY